jgi:hypothetical protein
MSIRLPFSLVNNNVSRDRLEVMPGYWWLYDLYALARNSWKYGDRDKRKTKLQHIEFDFLAPDTVEEIIEGMELLELWTGKALARRNTATPGSRRAAADTPGATADKADRTTLRRRGREYLLSPPEETVGTEDLEIPAEEAERSRRKTVVLKAREGYRAYRDMLLYYCLTSFVHKIDDSPGTEPVSAVNELAGKHSRDWINLGGQLVPRRDVDRLIGDISSGSLDSWTAVHKRYDELWKAYSREKGQHARAVFMDILSVDSGNTKEKLTAENLRSLLDEGLRIIDDMARGVYTSRAKDFENPFRKVTFSGDAEMEAVIGTVDGNPFIQRVEKQTADLKKRVRSIRDVLE